MENVAYNAYPLSARSEWNTIPESMPKRLNRGLSSDRPIAVSITRVPQLVKCPRLENEIQPNHAGICSHNAAEQLVSGFRNPALILWKTPKKYIISSSHLLMPIIERMNSSNGLPRSECQNPA